MQIIHDYDKNRSNIRLDKGNIVYDNNSLVLMTDEYDLILEVIQRSPKKDNSTVFIEIDEKIFNKKVNFIKCIYNSYDI